MNKYTLDFYYFDSCPFCNLVQNVITKNNIKVNYFNILENSIALNKLISDTGRKTVPVLYINGKPMHESSDIANWLEENKDQLEKNA